VARTMREGGRRGETSETSVNSGTGTRVASNRSLRRNREHGRLRSVGQATKLAACNAAHPTLQTAHSYRVAGASRA
jgi:hypothetical protein